MIVDDYITAALEIIKAAQKGRLPSSLRSPDWIVLELSIAQYSELIERLEDIDLLEFFQDKLRHDWDPDCGILVLRLMASPVHETLREDLYDDIKGRLRDLASSAADPDMSRHIAMIRSGGHASLQLESDSLENPSHKKAMEAEKSPDCRMNYGDTVRPQFVIEIAYSQKRASLQKLARDYYVGSEGEIKTVVTIDINYNPPDLRLSSASCPSTCDQSAKFCLYRGPRQICKDQAFRDKAGNPVEGGDLKLLLSDFIPDSVLGQLRRPLRRQAKTMPIDISASQLCQYLARGEHRQALEDRAKAIRKAQQSRPQPKSKKRKLAVLWELDEESVQKPSFSSSSPPSDSGAATRRGSKRGRTGSSDDREYRVSARTSVSLPGSERRETRAMSRSRSRACQ